MRKKRLFSVLALCAASCALPPVDIVASLGGGGLAGADGGNGPSAGRGGNFMTSGGAGRGNPNAGNSTGGKESSNPTAGTGGGTPNGGAGASGGETSQAGGGGSSVVPCGNGMKDADEHCDDGNTASGDGCSSTCVEEPGWTCNQSTPTQCAPICGDGVPVGPEAKAGGCDDHNTVSADGCSSTCTVEASYACSGTPSKCAKTCGDAKLQPGEACDDGNTTLHDGCASCAIETGYSCMTGAGASVCSDVNECADQSSNCDANATCANTVGAFTCTCKSGYSGSGVTCTDVNECTSGKSNCSSNATCANTPGSFNCTCKSGFVGDGVTCSDIDECKTGANNCNVNANCMNSTGSYSCACKGGYTGNGQTCSGQPGCNGLATTCGSSDCCTSSLVPGGTFNLDTAGHTATISSYTLDDYVVSVGRFRRFVSAYTAPPANGAGTHPKIAGTGWQSAWNNFMPANSATFAAALTCDAPLNTWDISGANDRLPMNCVSWYEAFAFCAWDGGRLPTEIEWLYAAQGGSDLRDYPWGAASPTSDLACYGCSSKPGGCTFSDICAVGSKSAGVGKYGQLDLVGLVFSWTFDYYAGYPSPCNNCANLTVPSSMYRTFKGSSFSETNLLSYIRGGTLPTDRNHAFGIRCAR